MFSFAITLPETIAPDLFGVISGIFSDLKPYVFIVLGVFIALRILSFIMNSMRPNTAKEAGYYHEFRNGKPTWRGREYEEGEEFDEYDDDDDDDE